MGLLCLIIHEVVERILAWQVRASILAGRAVPRWCRLSRSVVHEVSPGTSPVEGVRQAEPMTNFVDCHETPVVALLRGASRDSVHVDLAAVQDEGLGARLCGCHGIKAPAQRRVQLLDIQVERAVAALPERGLHVKLRAVGRPAGVNSARDAAEFHGDAVAAEDVVENLELLLECGLLCFLMSPIR